MIPAAASSPKPGPQRCAHSHSVDLQPQLFGGEQAAARLARLVEVGGVAGAGPRSPRAAGPRASPRARRPSSRDAVMCSTPPRPAMPRVVLAQMLQRLGVAHESFGPSGTSTSRSPRTRRVDAACRRAWSPPSATRPGTRSRARRRAARARAHGARAPPGHRAPSGSPRAGLPARPCAPRGGAPGHRAAPGPRESSGTTPRLRAWNLIVA